MSPLKRANFARRSGWVRVALGAQRGNILIMILWQGLRLVASGVVIGVLASLGLGHFLSRQVSGVSVTDAWTFAVVVVAFLAVSLVACLLHAQRAARGDPIAVLRYE